jgi:hypothetical protein
VPGHGRATAGAVPIGRLGIGAASAATDVASPVDDIRARSVVFVCSVLVVSSCVVSTG